MDYKIGYKTKPKEIRKNGIVIFTDGTNDILPNETTCLAYGYKYNDGICRAYTPTMVTEQKKSSEGTSTLGGSNQTTKSHNTQIVGEGNDVNEVTNSFVVGEENVIEKNSNNSVVFGSMGKATHLNEFCIGGGSFNSEAGLTQYSVLQLSNKSTGTADVDLNLESEATGTEITLPANSVTTYEIWLSGLVTGGSSGTPGDYDTMEYHGTIRCGNTGTLTHNAKITRQLGRTGSLATKTIDTATAYTLKIQVAGLSNVTSQWHAVVKLHINKTNAVTF